MSKLSVDELTTLDDADLSRSFSDLLSYLDTGGEEEEKASEIIAERGGAIGGDIRNALTSQDISIDLKIKLLNCYFKMSGETKLEWYNHCAEILFNLNYRWYHNTPTELEEVMKSILSDLQSAYTVPTVENAKSIIPNQKSDYEKAILIDMASIEVIKAVKNELFEWIADCNWPIAQCILSIFANRFNELKELYAEFLDKGTENGYDVGITCSLLFSFYLCKNKDEWQFLKENLTRIATLPSKNEQSEYLDEYAKEILDYMQDIEV